jgi:hypothetical protein
VVSRRGGVLLRGGCFWCSCSVSGGGARGVRVVAGAGGGGGVWQGLLRVTGTWKQGGRRCSIIHELDAVYVIS